MTRGLGGVKACDRMLARGMTPRFIAEITGWPQDEVSKRVVVGAARLVTDDDFSLAMNHLIWRSHEWAMGQMENGVPAIQLQIARSVLGPAAREVGKGQQAQIDDMREEFKKLFVPKDYRRHDSDDPDNYDPSRAPVPTFDNDKLEAGT